MNVTVTVSFKVRKKRLQVMHAEEAYYQLVATMLKVLTLTLALTLILFDHPNPKLVATMLKVLP